MPNSSIWPVDKSLSSATIPGQSGPGSDGSEGVQSSSITGNSPLDCFVSYLGHSLVGLTPLQRSSRYILLP